MFLRLCLGREAEVAAVDGRGGSDHERTVCAAADSLDGAAAELLGQNVLAGRRRRIVRIEALVGEAGATGDLGLAAGLDDGALVDPIGEGVQRTGGRTAVVTTGARRLVAQGLVGLDLPL